MSRESGSASLELALMTPALIVLLLFVTFAGRVTQARGEVEAAARDAARAASVARSATGAEEDGGAAAGRALAAGGVTCRQLDTHIDTSNFRAGGDVAATVTCTVDFSDLALLAVPATKTISVSFRQPVDAYRGTAS